MRNVDPLGRQLQKMFVSRSRIILDTDIVLALLIKELPEHKVVLTSIQALIGIGTKILIP